MAYTCNDISTSPVSLGYAREKSASTTVRNYLNFPRIILLFSQIKTLTGIHGRAIDFDAQKAPLYAGLVFSHVLIIQIFSLLYVTDINWFVYAHIHVWYDAHCLMSGRRLAWWSCNFMASWTCLEVWIHLRWWFQNFLWQSTDFPPHQLEKKSLGSSIEELTLCPSTLSKTHANSQGMRKAFLLIIFALKMHLLV